MHQCEQHQQACKKQADKYDRLAQQLNLPSYQDEATFHDVEQQADMLRHQIAPRLTELKSERDRYVQDSGKLTDVYEVHKKELASLKQRSSQLPSDDVRIRQAIATALDLPETELPFVGELLRVRSSEQQWEPAIERLLHGFGRQLLVAEQHYQQVSHYVDHTNLRGRLVYHRVNGTRVPHQNGRLEPDALYHKLEVKPNTPFTRWLNAELIDGFQYRCCETLDEFQNAYRALTRNGLVKHGHARHEKDDRTQLGDRTRYILGWSNKEKQEAITHEMEHLRTNIAQTAAHIKRLDDLQTQEQSRQHGLEQLLEFDSFETIDWRTVQRQVLNLQTQLRELESSSTHLTTLTRQLRELEAQQRTQQKEHTDVLTRINNLEQDIKRCRKQEQKCQSVLSQYATANQGNTGNSTSAPTMQEDAGGAGGRPVGKGLAPFFLPGSGISPQPFFLQVAVGGNISKADPLESPAQSTAVLDAIEKDLRELLEREKSLTLSLETIDEACERLRDFYRSRASSLQSQSRHLEMQIVNRMRDFRQTSPAYEQEMDASVEALDEYRCVYQRIRHDDLPRHRRRFKELLNEKVVTDIGSFKAVLEQQEDLIQESIAHLNESLSSIAYTDTTYIQLIGERTHDASVREFRSLLRGCLPDIGQPVDESCFERIRALLQRLEQEPNWASKVTDVRSLARFLCLRTLSRRQHAEKLLLRLLWQIRGPESQTGLYHPSLGHRLSIWIGPMGGS